MRRIHFLGFLLISFIFQALVQQNYTPEQANSIINSTLSYLNTINQSGYIIFYPSLSEAYAYLNNATKLYNTSPNTAVAYALKAKEIASEEYMRISSYRLESFISVLLFTLFMLFLLYLYIRPVKKKKLRKAMKS